ncbi:hypothetical protein B0H65DRAFT_11230 [Neurospora tetraspora]|uniref:Uncharacterized protein n=1 Tax=Neurospora tetraspora TaxID=94610 RepID=A0AAE0MW35_9PEZI|nr:hypothetical protein B0H65DRAFT_11230 [Neurospora tetraspora]
MRRASTCCTASLEACSQLSKMLGCFCPQNNHYTYPTFTRTTTAIYGTCFDIISVYFELKSMNHLPLHVVMIVNSQSSAHYLSRDHFPAFRLGVLAFIQPALLTLDCLDLPMPLVEEKRISPWWAQLPRADTVVKRPSTAGLAVQYSSAGPASQHPSDALIWNNTTATYLESHFYAACKSFILAIIEKFESITMQQDPFA